MVVFKEVEPARDLMNRRSVIRLLSSFAAATPLSSLAQHPGQLRAIGFLNGGSAIPYASMVAAFRAGLKEVAAAGDREPAVIYRWAEGDYTRLPQLAADLASQKVGVIAATGGDVSALAAQAATTTIPIVFNIGGDPVQLGLVASLNRPGGNITGVVQFTFELATKRLEILRELVPGAEVVATLLNPTRPNAQGRLQEVQEAARAYGKRLVALHAADEHGINEAFPALIREGARARYSSAPTRSFSAEDSGSSSWRHGMPFRQFTTGATTPRPADLQATERAFQMPIAKSACMSAEYSMAKCLLSFRWSSPSGSSSLSI